MLKGDLIQVLKARSLFTFDYEDLNIIVEIVCVDDDYPHEAIMFDYNGREYVTHKKHVKLVYQR